MTFVRRPMSYAQHLTFIRFFTGTHVQKHVSDFLVVVQLHKVSVLDLEFIRLVSLDWFHWLSLGLRLTTLGLFKECSPEVDAVSIRNIKRFKIYY